MLQGLRTMARVRAWSSARRTLTWLLTGCSSERDLDAGPPCGHERSLNSAPDRGRPLLHAQESEAARNLIATGHEAAAVVLYHEPDLIAVCSQA